MLNLDIKLQEVAAYESQIDEIVKQYIGQYVAMRQGKVVDYDADRIVLLQRIDEQYPDEFVLIRHVSEEQSRPLRLPSPRARRKLQDNSFYL